MVAIRVPESSVELEETIVRIVAEVCDQNPQSIERDRDLTEYGLDSVRSIDLVVGLEDAFGVAITNEAIRTLKTVEDLTRHIEELRR